ncbi:MAG: L-histidine N(alpha)-methyltransferase [Vicinamibacterales bacterium]
MPARRSSSAPASPPAAPTAEVAALAAHVAEGLSAPQKFLSSRYFYDDEGSRLFQQIMALPEYYLTRVEHEILRMQGPGLAADIVDGADAVDLVELGAGDGEKTITLCQALAGTRVPVEYFPVDVSPFALSELAARFESRLPAVPVHPTTGDYLRQWPATTPGHRQVVLLLGSNLGNFTPEASLALLRRVRSQIADGDLLVLGLDLQKDPHVIRSAYDDGAGVTAQFNLNLLRRLNRELGMDFDLDRFSHYTCYNPLDGAVRSFLVSRVDQKVHSGHLGRTFAFRAGETIYTEQSQKYTDALIARLAGRSGFDVRHHHRDPKGWYTVVVWQAGDRADTVRRTFAGAALP